MRVIESNLHDPHNKLLIKLNTLISYQPHVYRYLYQYRSFSVHMLKLIKLEPK